MSLIEFYFIMIFIMMVMTIIGTLWSLITFLTTFEAFCTYVALVLQMHNSLDVFPRTFSLNIGCSIQYSMLPLDSLIPCLHSLLGYSTGDFQALQLVVLVVYGAVDKPLASCMLVHFGEV